MDEYWNHNVAYHRWIVRQAVRHGVRDALDVGCGDGLLLRRLAPAVTTATGIEPDTAAAERARARLSETPNATVVRSRLASYDPGTLRFDLITFVATLHHMDPSSALAAASALLRPGGLLLVVGLSATRSLPDRTLSALALPCVRLGSLLHRETRDIGVPVAEPRESLAEIRALARGLLPGVRIRRGLYYRYLLKWTKPSGGVDS